MCEIWRRTHTSARSTKRKANGSGLCFFFSVFPGGVAQCRSVKSEICPRTIFGTCENHVLRRCHRHEDMCASRSTDFGLLRSTLTAAMARTKKATQQRREALAKRNQPAVPKRNQPAVLDHAVPIDTAAATVSEPATPVAQAHAVPADESSVRAHSEKHAAVPFAMAHASADTTEFSHYSHRQVTRKKRERLNLTLTPTASSSNVRDRPLRLKRKREEQQSVCNILKPTTASQGSDSDSVSSDESSADNAAPLEQPNAAAQKLDFAAEVSNDAQDDNAASEEVEPTNDEEPEPGDEIFGRNLEERLAAEDFPLLPDLTPDEHDDNDNEDEDEEEDDEHEQDARSDQIEVTAVGADFYNPDPIDLAPEDEYNADAEPT
jgi:hypothetical protein